MNENSPVVLRQKPTPHPSPHRTDMRSLDLRSYGAHYDYFLFVATPDKLGRLRRVMAKSGMRLVAQSGRFAAYERVGGALEGS